MDPITLRFIERILAVIIGGISVYLGYRLFLKVPEQKDSDGKITFPKDITIVLNRVGPGVFFALFGVTVVVVSLYQAITYSEHELPDSNKPKVASPGKEFVGAGGTADEREEQARAASRELLRGEIAILNSISSSLSPNLLPAVRNQIEQALPRIKFALMETVWDDPNWGDRVEFRRWIEGGASDPPPKKLKEAALQYFYYPKAIPKGGSTQ